MFVCILKMLRAACYEATEVLRAVACGEVCVVLAVVNISSGVYWCGEYW